MAIALKDIVTISGHGGLFRVIKPTHHGLLVERLDEHKQRSVKNAQGTKISTLQDISIYITNEEQESIPLSTLFGKLHEAFSTVLSPDLYDTSDKLRALLLRVVPDYDQRRVYTSDIKKMIHWYNLLVQYAPELLTSKDDGKGDHQNT